MVHIANYDIVIIGGGPSGLTAAIYAMRAAMKTIMIEKASAGGQMNLSDAVENWPGEQCISGSELSHKMLEHAKTYGLEMISETVTTVKPGLKAHTIQLANGNEINAHAIILATGGSPKQLGIPGENENYGAGVSYCAVCDGFFFKDLTVTVVGGGDSAVEEALYLAKIAHHVYIIHRRNDLRASALLQERLKQESKIEVLWNTVVKEICAKNGSVNAVLLQDTQTGEKRSLDTDGVFIFIGFEPSNGIVPVDIKMNKDGYVITDEKCETNVPGLFAIGDLREKFARQIITAAADGCTAALAAAYHVEAKLAGVACD